MGILESALRQERASLLRMVQIYERKLELTPLEDKARRAKYLEYIKAAYEDLAVIERAGIE